MIVEILDKSFEAVAWEKVDYRVPILINIDLLSLNILFFFFHKCGNTFISYYKECLFTIKRTSHYCQQNFPMEILLKN